MLTVDDLLSLRGVGGARISPDGRLVAFEVAAAYHGTHAEPRGTAIWLVEAATGYARQLTTGTARNTAPAWSPDGRNLAFLSDRDGGANRLHLLPLDGGEARALDTGVKAARRVDPNAFVGIAGAQMPGWGVMTMPA